MHFAIPQPSLRAFVSLVALPPFSMDLPSHKAHSSQAKDSADLSYSRLVEVPAELFRLHHLRTLRLDNNSLSSVPWSSLMALESLTHVNLSHNKLSELPEALAKWHKVEVLNVSHNRIAAFSQTLRPLLLRAYYIIPLRPFCTHSGNCGRPDREDLIVECPHLTRALIKQFGNKIPASFRASYPSRYHYIQQAMEQVTANPQIEIMDYASSSPHVYWQPLWASRGTSMRHDVRPGKAYWKFVAGAAPRVRLEGASLGPRSHTCTRNAVRLGSTHAAHTDT